MDDAISTVRNALNGGDLDLDALDKLNFNKPEALACRETLIPLIVQLVAVNPDAAQQIPEDVLTTLLLGMTLSDVLNLSQLNASHFSIPLVRPLLLSQVAEKATESDVNIDSAEYTSDTDKLIREAFSLIADPELETKSVASIDMMTSKLPRAALAFVPFGKLHSGPAELQSRLMEINIRLLRRRTPPPSEYLLWDPLASEDDDILLAALQTDYVGNLIPFFTAQPSIQKQVHSAVFTLCKRYRNSSIDNTIEPVLARLSQELESLFLELDAQFLLIRHDRPSLIAQVPALYIIRNHPEIIEKLELNAANLYAIANVCQEFRGLQLLHLTKTKVAGLPRPSQLLICSAATNSKEGADLFYSRFTEILQNAMEMPDTEDYRELKATLKANLSRWGLKIRKQPSVSTA